MINSAAMLDYRVSGLLRFSVLLTTVAVCPALAQQANSAAAAEVLALEAKIEDAIVRGDVRYVDSILADDFSFVHGDAWTTGGKPLASDDKAAFLKRVADKEYLVHDLDAVKTEVHGDIAITYGRYVSLFVPQNRNAAPARLNSIWFERVYAKRNGRWVFLSHRTVHGPTVAPAGVDPLANSPSRPGAGSTGETSTQATPTGAAGEVLDLERSIGAAICKGDAAFYDRATADDFVMTHSDRWTTGGKPLLVDDKASFRKRIENRSYVSMDFDSVTVEMHGDVAITYGRYVSNMRGVAPDRAWFSVWYEKVYAKRNGQWVYLSHRTVNGANYGLTKAEVADR